jgi:hypothetical protein
LGKGGRACGAHALSPLAAHGSLTPPRRSLSPPSPHSSSAAAAPRRLLQDQQQQAPPTGALANIAAGNPVPDPPGGTGFVAPTSAYAPVGTGPVDAGASSSTTTGPRRAAAVAANVLASALLAPAPAPANADGTTAPAGRVVKLPAFGAVPSLGLPALPALQFAVDREQLAAARGALGLKNPPGPGGPRAPRREKAPRDVAPSTRGPHGHKAEAAAAAGQP